MLSVERKHYVSDQLNSKAQIKPISDSSDMVMTILLPLPIKDVLRSKCVCKHWCSIISDPIFSYNYCRVNPRANFVAGLFLYEWRRPHHPRFNFVYLNGQTIRDPFHSLNFVDASSDIHRIWSCNGLLCLCVKNYETYSLHGRICETYSKSYYICNPTTKQSTRIPDLKRPPMSNTLSMALAFDPRKSMHYKVVCIWVFKARYQFSVYSSETRLWRDVLSFKVGKDDNFFFELGVFWSNALHWVSSSGPFLCVDVDNECLKTMPATPILTWEQTRTIGYFGESLGHLHLVETHRSLNNNFYVLELQRDYSEWLVTHQVSYELYLQAHPGLKPNDMNILCILRSEEEEDSLSLVVSTPHGTILFRVSYKGYVTSCRLHYIEKDKEKYKWHHAHQYIVSLSSV